MTKKYTFCLAIVLAALISYFLIPKALFWDPIDRYVFFSLNSMLSLGKPIQLFWAFLNHPINDWVVDLVYIALIWDYIRQPSLISKKTKGWQIAIIAVFIAFIIFVVNRQIFRYIIEVDAISPSLKFKEYLHINRLLPFFKTKIYSHSSFPGDHATNALMFFFLTAPLFKQRFLSLRIPYFILILMPRLVVGAHNLSDIVIGSGVIVFISYSLFYKLDWLSKLTEFFSKNQSPKYPKKI